jgi:hypothetical protein
MDLLTICFVVCLLALYGSWFLMLTRVKKRDLDIRWWERTVWKVYRLYREYYPNSKLVWIFWASLIGTLVFFTAGSRLQYIQKH